MRFLLVIIFLLSFELISLTAFGYWVRGEDISSINLSDLHNRGVTDLFVKSNVFKENEEKVCEEWFKKAIEKKIKVHIWIKCFYRNDNWIDPAISDTQFIIDEAVSFAKKFGVSGINLDYVRYHSNNLATEEGTKAISKFIQKAVKKIHEARPNCIVSAAILPEKDSLVYGQDFSVFSDKLDLVLPMIYKGNYHKGTSWIKETAKWYFDKSKSAKILVGLLSYKSDNDVIPLEKSQLAKDIKAAIADRSKFGGVILFRWGKSYNIDFNHLEYY